MNSSKNTFKYLILLLILFAGLVTVYSQSKPPNKVQNSNKNSDEEKKRQQFIKEQAILLLKEVLLNSKSVEDIGQRAYIVGEASSVLWKFDSAFAQDSILSSTNEFISRYDSILNQLSENEDDKINKRELNYAIKILLSKLAKNNLKLYNQLQKKFFLVKTKESSDSSSDTNEKLKMASEGLDLDTQQTVDLVSRIIEIEIPEGFPKFFNDLRKKNVVLAENLLRRAVLNLSSKISYNAKDAVILGISVFNEQGLILPYFESNQNLTEFFLRTTFVNRENYTPNKVLVSDYFSACQSFVNSRLQNQANNFFSSPNNFIQTYFLVKKLQAYNRLYRVANDNNLALFDTNLVALSQPQQIQTQILTNLIGFAERTATNNNPFNFDNGKSALEKAENSKDPREKMSFLIEGIIQLIEKKKFDEAEKKISEIEVSEIETQLKLLLNVRVALSNIEKADWNEFESRLKKINDKQIKAFLYLKAAFVLSSLSKSQLFDEYTFEAGKNLAGIDDKLSKASGLALLSFLLLPSKQNALPTFYDAIKEVNASTEYDEDRFVINIRIPGRNEYFAEFLGSNEFQKCFEKLAKSNWENSQVLTIQLNSPSLKYIAQVSTARAVLQ
jgi:hypothetical protein